MSDHIVDSNKMVETPRTDEAQFGTGRVSVDFARTLERELDAANAEIERMKQRLSDAKADAASWHDQAQMHIDSLLKSDDRVKELEEWIRGLEKVACHECAGELFGDDWLDPGQCAYVGQQKPEGLR